MKTIALISRKGGCGKTTLTVHLAVCAIKEGKTVAIIDIDEQASAFDWYQARSSQNELIAIEATPEKLPELLDKARKGGVDLVIIDTAPHTDRKAAKVADLAELVLVPCRPSRLDMKAVPSTMAIVQLAKTPAYIVMNGVPPIGKLGEETKNALEGQGFFVLSEMVSNRVAFNYALTDGRSVHEYEPEGKAAQEITALYKAIMN